jgi:hypothetical protein
LVTEGLCNRLRVESSSGHRKAQSVAHGVGVLLGNVETSGLSHRSKPLVEVTPGERLLGIPLRREEVISRLQLRSLRCAFNVRCNALEIAGSCFSPFLARSRDPGVLLLKMPYTRDTLISKLHAVLHGRPTTRKNNRDNSLGPRQFKAWRLFTGRPDRLVSGRTRRPTPRNVAAGIYRKGFSIRKPPNRCPC